MILQEITQKKGKQKLQPFCRDIYQSVQKKWDALAKPLDGLGDFEKMIARIGAIQKSENPSIEERTLLVFLSDNGIIAEGVSQSGAEVTHKVAEAMAQKRSTVCIMAEEANVEVFPVDVGMKGTFVSGIENCRIREGTRNFLHEPAMTRAEAYQAMETGYQMAQKLQSKGTRLLLLGEMGIGNTSTATAVGCALLDLDPQIMTGRGAGLSEKALVHKGDVIRQALLHQVYDPKDALDVLTCFGGFDIAAMAGAILYGAENGLPIVLDGLITLSAALIAQALAPGSTEACIASHNPREPMGRKLLSVLGLTAPIDAGLALGEGTGAVLLMPLLDVCMALYDKGTQFAGIGMEAYQRWDPSPDS